MPRRVGLPGASELFRSTGSELTEEADAARARAAGPRTEGPDTVRLNGETARTNGTERVDRVDSPPRRGPAAGVQPDTTVEHTGRVRHDEKITVYVSSEELLALERLRVDLRAEHGLAVDRGRIVRAAIASALAAIVAEGGASDVVRRLASAS